MSTTPTAAVLAVETRGPAPTVQVRQRREPLRLALELRPARLRPDVPRETAVNDPEGVITRLQAVQHQVDATPLVTITAYLREQAPFEVEQSGGTVRLVLAKPAAAAAATASVPSPAPAEPPAPPQGPATPKYTGERISLDFQDADIKDVLRLIAEVSGLNIIAGPDVKGTVTTRMVDVPWDQALDVILKVNGLGQEREGNIIRVAPLERFISERQALLRAQETEVQIEPTVTRVVPISYADVNQLKQSLEPLLSGRGSIFIDERTNTLIISDTAKNLETLLELVKTLDRQTPQVMIEARIVETSRNFLRNLGVQLAGQFVQLTDARFPNRIAVRGGIPAAEGGVLAPPDAGNFLLDLPAAVTTGQGAAIGFSLANPGLSQILDIQLSALEASGQGKVISNPKIATLDNTEALIQSGLRIPFETVSAEGTQTQFVDASISLKVTPHVTPDGYISMKITATKNEPDFSRTSAQGAPTIITREATTEMLVRDGDTVVIGGLFRRTVQAERSGVPGLSKVPVLGWLFQTTRQSEENDELLIFITPRIIRQPEEEPSARRAPAY
ncbi:MAG: hypothetical protein KatS3mg131_0538 [Candidatus Tectimicrobiota bacterium]|nr:MAG: hypothetical protein KatS3mg131_0538 [Candidatus Tectomicrobia bacterium]